MKFSAPASLLIASLSAIGHIVEKRNVVPILSNVKLELGSNQLLLTATDLDLEITTSIAIPEMFAKGEITAPAHMLLDIVKKYSPADTVSFELQSDGNSMRVKSGRSKFDIQVLPATDFPSLSVGTYSHRFEMAAAELRSALQNVNFAISTEETRYYLNGVHLHGMTVGNEAKLRFVATDGHRLARQELPAPAGAFADESFFKAVIIPRKTVGVLIRLLDKEKGNAVIELSDTKVRVAIGPWTITSKLIDGTFPDYQRVIPSNNNTLVTVDRAALSSATDRVGTVANERGRAVKLDFDSGQLRMTMRNPNAGDAEESIDIDFTAAPLAIGFNSKYLTDVLAVLASKSVTIKLADPGSPTIFQDPDNDNLLVVLMPMRV